MTEIHTIDLHYLGQPCTIAGYLLMGPDGPVLIETGPASTLDHLEAGLKQHGVVLNDLRGALVTHIHLDHAGAAGHLAKHGVPIHVHEFGAKHLVDPSKLIDSARRIYRDQMDRLWGEVLPVPAHLVRSIRDGDVIDIAGLVFAAIETPGHARHHHAFRLETPRGRICFTGDAAAMIVPGYPFISLPTPPPEFDLDAWLNSLARLDAERFRMIYLTHFGCLNTPTRHFENVKRALRAHSEFIRTQLNLSKSEDEILQSYRPWIERQALAGGISEQQLPHFVSENLLRMNVTGMVRYWTKTRA